MKKLLQQISARFPGGKLPDHYVVFDTETNGVNPEKCIMMQVGMCFVSNRKITSRFSQVIRRPDDLYIHPKALAVHGIDHDRMAREGEFPDVVIPMLVDTFKQARQDGFAFLGHNLTKFDARILEIESAHLGCPFSFEDNEIIDVGMLAKASQLDMEFDSPQESLRSFYTRVVNVWPCPIKWALASYCLNFYKLRRFVSQEMIDSAHDAGADCILSHWTFEVMRDTTFGGTYAVRKNA